MQNGLDGLSRLKVPEDLHEVEVATAFPLNPKETKMIEDRLRQALGRAVRLKTKEDPALILGEHGDSMVPIWSSATVAGLPLEKFPALPCFAMLKK